MQRQACENLQTPNSRRLGASVAAESPALQPEPHRPKPIRRILLEKHICSGHVWQRLTSHNFSGRKPHGQCTPTFPEFPREDSYLIFFLVGNGNQTGSIHLLEKIPRFDSAPPAWSMRGRDVMASSRLRYLQTYGSNNKPQTSKESKGYLLSA